MEIVQKIVIIDYGMANLRSVQKAFARVGALATITSLPGDLEGADKLVLPGVGAFRDAIVRLRQTGLADPILAHVRAGKPFLGICLGLQLLFTTSFEDGAHHGLDLLPGEVVRFPHLQGLKVPHMGWNQLRFRRPAPLFHEVPDGSTVYFVHSYYAVPRNAEVIAAETDYPEPFASIIWHENILATQFHPEKSQRVGLTMLRNFAQL
jgi:glutamine amidotransferase